MAASKWPPYSSLPHIAPDGTVSEPLSGRFSVECRPDEGGEGIQRAIRDCEVGGSLLLTAGVYSLKQPLFLRRRVHLFGGGMAELHGEISRASGSCWDTIISSSSATLDRVRITDQPLVNSLAAADTICVTSGHLLLQGCDISSCGHKDAALRVSGPSTVADVLRCTLSGSTSFDEGATGRVEDCDIQGEGGIGIAVYNAAGTSPFVSRCMIRDCSVGVSINNGTPSPGPLAASVSNVFLNCGEDVV